MDISQRGRAVALSFLSPLPELRRWSRDFLLHVLPPSFPPPRPRCLTVSLFHAVSIVRRSTFCLSVPPFFPRFSLVQHSSSVFSLARLFHLHYLYLYFHPLPPLPPISRLADELNRAGGPPYFCLASRVHSPCHCSDCDRTETSWALLLVERTIYRTELARRETKEELREFARRVAIGPALSFGLVDTRPRFVSHRASSFLFPSASDEFCRRFRYVSELFRI